ncbi:MAG: hypothetical protein KDJ54_11715 [Candidatus Competibacteraceae bacterium]|nr:hypothetical protein [Candidatus Competibacteraceae bacterium]
MSKVYRDLYPALTDFQNLLDAYRKAASGKRRQPQVAGFEFAREGHLLQLQRELRAKTYCPGPYHSFHIRDPKRRLVSAAPFRDRVVHHALCNVIEPLFERTFIGDSYANRVGKGTHHALDRAQAFARRYRYVLQCDVREFFPSVDHARLRALIARTIADPDVLWLIDQILENGADVPSLFGNGRQIPTARAAGRRQGKKPARPGPGRARLGGRPNMEPPPRPVGDRRGAGAIRKDQDHARYG